ncbi:uncharacterized protein LOC122077580 [Macadamia integrifolia]|uniref:uncharacterized protein LOC122077580 n=1 Tax=Macadamia integrifolia TaxID=60698 RepID=UPI001C4F4341|nr:uncharacterized protein LOC122077580 [Macadamia integrifolia]
MEETAETGGGATSMDEETLSRVFSQLKAFSVNLLDLLQNPKKDVRTLSELAEFLRRTPAEALQPFFDYTLFPLLLLLDTAVGCRSSPETESYGSFGMINMQKTPHKVSDSVAESMLLCLEELLKKCHFGSVDQMVLVLKKLTYGALLSPFEAAEEFREGIVRCFRTLLLGLYPCSDDSCTCKQISGLPTLLPTSGLQMPPVPLKCFSKPEKCLIAYLQSQNASAAVGHWLSLLLEIAGTEAARGHRGSAKLRVEAFLAIRVLIAKVGTADALAFFLPGVVSKFAKVLHVSKTMVSGAAGSVEATDQAIRGLAEFLSIVLEDEANVCCLDMSTTDITGSNPNKDKSTQSFLEALRHLPTNNTLDLTERGDSNAQEFNIVTPLVDLKEKSNVKTANALGSFYVSRTKDWIKETSAHVDRMLGATFPHLVVHPSKKVRQGLLDAIRGLLSKCCYSLKKSRLMLMECLCVLVCDNSEEVSMAAQEFLEFLFISGEKDLMESEIAEMFGRLVEKLPRAVLGSEETVAVLHAQQLLALIYYAGPQIVVHQLLCSPIAAARFFDVLALCLSQNSVFAGSLDKLISAKPVSVGYLHSISELKAGGSLVIADKALMNVLPSRVPKFSEFDDKACEAERKITCKNYELPRMPPWFIYIGSQKLYEAIAGTLRLVGLSTVADPGYEVSLSTIVDIPLARLRKLVSEIRMKEHYKESWNSWYARSGSGQLLREASTAVCILNEIVYGLSDESIDIYGRMFGKSRMNREDIRVSEMNHADSHFSFNDSFWKICHGKVARTELVDCIGSILHEYLSPELWVLPIDQKCEQDSGPEEITLHFFRDTTMLHQVIIDGIGIFSLSLGKYFSSSGFLHSSLFLLLENLICSSYQIRSASDAVLHILAASSGHPTVGCLVVSNADYIIDSLCRQLRHLDLNPHVPDVLAAMLSYIGVAHDILPLLDEPMRSVSLELEVLGRHQHPDLTIPFLKAVAEIAKASKHEAIMMPTQAESYASQVKSVVSVMEESVKQDSGKKLLSHDNHDIEPCDMESEIDANSKERDSNLEHCEKMLFVLNENRRYRRIVGSLAGSCLVAATPLLSSARESACIVALNIIEDGIATLAKVEEAYKHEKEAKVAIEKAIKIISFYDLQDMLDAADDGTDENRLLPAMNKIWPYLVVCVKNKKAVAIHRCLGVVSNVVQICGGDFFSRRFHNDGSHFWKLLATSPFQKKSKLKSEERPLQLPYRSTSTTSEDVMAEVSSMKIQAAALNMIADLSRNKRSASALEVVLKKVSGLLVGIACSGVIGLRDASVNALSGLACIDPDLIWLLLADVYYSLNKKDIPLPPTSDFPEISQILSPPESSKEYLYVQYGGESFGFDIDLASVEFVFQKLLSEVFNSQKYN